MLDQEDILQFMSGDMNCVLPSNTKISGVLMNNGLSILSKASMNGTDQPLHWKGQLVRSSRNSKLKELEASKSRNLYDSDQNIQKAYRLSESSDLEDGALEKERSISLGLRTYPSEHYSKQRGGDNKEGYQNKWRGKNEHLDRRKNKAYQKVRAIEQDRVSILALAEERQENVPNKEDMVKQVENGSSFKAHRPSSIEPRKLWTFTQVIPQLNACLYWRGIAPSLAISGALLSIIHLIFFRVRNQKPSSIRRRIVRSQWYGNPSPLPMEKKGFERRLHLTPEHPRFLLDTNKFKAQSSFIQRSHRPSLRLNTGGINNELLESRRAPQKPIRQPLHGRNELPPMSLTLDKYQRLEQVDSSHQKHTLAHSHNGALTTETGLPARRISFRNSRRGRSQMQDDNKETKPLNMLGVNKEASRSRWGRDEELDLDTQISQLYNTVQSVEHHRQAVMIALAEERQRSMLLEEKIAMQKQAAASLAKEVQLLKESHNALLTSFRKKYSSAAAARAAADLVYQDFEGKAAAEKQW